MLVSSVASAEVTIPADSAESAKKVKTSPVIATARLHSMGYFSFTGRLISNNPASDLFINFRHRSWGINIFKAVDLYDHRSPNNFTLALAYRTFQVTPKLTIAPFAGVVLEQTKRFADHGSDFSAVVTTTLKLSPTLTVDHTALFSNLVLERSMSDWVNRLRLIYSRSHLDATLLVWHNNGVFDQSHYASTAITTTYARVKINERLLLSSGITGLYMVNASRAVDYVRKKGIVLTIGVSFQ